MREDGERMEGRKEASEGAYERVIIFLEYWVDRVCVDGVCVGRV